MTGLDSVCKQDSSGVYMKNRKGVALSINFMIYPLDNKRMMIIYEY